MLDDVIVGGMKGVFLYPASKKKTFFLQHMTKYEETKTVKKFRHDPLVLWTRSFHELGQDISFAQKKIDEIQISLQTPNMVTEGIACEGLKDKRKRPLT